LSVQVSITSHSFLTPHFIFFFFCSVLGIAGLATAFALAQSGHRVRIFEKRSGINQVRNIYNLTHHFKSSDVANI